MGGGGGWEDCAKCGARVRGVYMTDFPAIFLFNQKKKKNRNND